MTTWMQKSATLVFQEKLLSLSLMFPLDWLALLGNISFHPYCHHPSQHTCVIIYLYKLFKFVHILFELLVTNWGVRKIWAYFSLVNESRISH